jgi:serine/threonine protein kinase
MNIKTKPSELPDDTIVGGYRILRKVAAGGFGMIYQAEDEEGRQVAIKEYLPVALVTRNLGEKIPTIRTGKGDLFRLGLKCFFEEGRTLAQINHPSVVSVLNFFQENETVYLVMNYLKGASLQEFIVTARELRQEKIFRESTIRSLFDEIFWGLRAVHQYKLLHLDIKPANIFITDDNHAVLVDFGAAREVLTKEGSFTRPMYTPGFAAPEMYKNGATMGPWTDIYALGACIFSCMKGFPPQDVPKRIENDTIPSLLGKLRGVYSDDLIRIVLWCMDLNSAQRPQSIFSLHKEMNREGKRQYTAYTIDTKGPSDSI